MDLKPPRPAAPPRRPAPRFYQSAGEERASSISHGAALALALAGGICLLVRAAERGQAAAIVGAGLFALGMAAVYTTSMLYHAFPHRGRAKRVFLILDHDAIYLLIAGSYSPFALGPLRGAAGWTLLGVVWGLAALGIALKSTLGTRATKLSTGLYVAMGWIGLCFAPAFYHHLPAACLGWLLAGGITYSAGVPFFLMEGRRAYSHLVWHLFVMAGTACHFVAIWNHAV